MGCANKILISFLDVYIVVGYVVVGVLRELLLFFLPIFLLLFHYIECVHFGSNELRKVLQLAKTL